MYGAVTPIFAATWDGALPSELHLHEISLVIAL